MKHALKPVCEGDFYISIHSLVRRSPSFTDCNCRVKIQFKTEAHQRGSALKHAFTGFNHSFSNMNVAGTIQKWCH